jgi:hypothetical protein
MMMTSGFAIISRATAPRDCLCADSARTLGSENTASTAKSDLRREALESDDGAAQRREDSPSEFRENHCGAVFTTSS